MSAISNLLGAVIRLIYNLVGHNYGLSIILFAFLTKLILFPLTLKQTKSMKQMEKLKPLEEEIRKKYNGNKEKISEELTKMYSENKINPLGGCLPLIIQIPLIFAMFWIVKQPLTYVKQIPQETIIEYAKEVTGKEDITEKNFKDYELEVANKKDLDLNMKFAGLNFGDIPSNSVKKDLEQRPTKWTLLVPILSFILTTIQTIQTRKSSSQTQEQKDQMKTMNIMMPVLSAYIAYITPLALGVYWLVGSVFQIMQQFIINAIMKKEDKKMLKQGGK